jgi:hypothetical protein
LQFSLSYISSALQVLHALIVLVERDVIERQSCTVLFLLSKEKRAPTGRFSPLQRVGNTACS